MINSSGRSVHCSTKLGLVISIIQTIPYYVITFECKMTLLCARPSARVTIAYIVQQIKHLIKTVLQNFS